MKTVMFKTTYGALEAADTIFVLDSILSKLICIYVDGDTIQIQTMAQRIEVVGETLQSVQKKLGLVAAESLDAKTVREETDVCRSPYCECDVDKCSQGKLDMRGPERNDAARNLKLAQEIITAGEQVILRGYMPIQSVAHNGYMQACAKFRKLSDEL